MRIAAGIGAAAAAAASLALLWTAGALSRLRRRGLGAVSADCGLRVLETADGPLKVAYDAERTEALQGCTRVPW